MAIFLLLFRPECAIASSVSSAQGNKILIVTSNQHTYGDSIIQDPSATVSVAREIIKAIQKKI